MKKIILFIANSLDGYIADVDGHIDWVWDNQEYGFADFSKRIDTLVMGGETFRQMSQNGNYPYSRIKSVVFTLKGGMHAPENVTFFSGDIFEYCEVLKETAEKDIWLVGGPEMVSQLMGQRLVDEIILSVHPVILGNGIRLFEGDMPRHDLKLLSIQSFPSGLIQFHYVVK
jgi:dihydrofolate reductase